MERIDMRRLFGSLTAFLLACVLCLGAALPTFAATAQSQTDPAGTEMIKARLLKQIREEGWDPYSSDMTLDEFHALMALFEAGTLPFRSTAAIAASKDVTATMIPRTMFYVTGLPQEVMDTLPEDDVTGDRFPATDWAGFEEGSVYDEADRIVMSENVSDTTAFPRYDKDFYVRRVTVQGIESAVLGILYNPEDAVYVYYYLSPNGEYHDVSTTALPEGDKFIIQYAPNEHSIDYRVERNGEDVTDEWADIVFGTTRPTETTGGAYSFDITAPYFYTTAVYVETETMPRTEIHGVSGTQFPLGTEPVYENVFGYKVHPNTEKGPAALISQDTFRNDFVTEDRTVIAVLEEKSEPVFDMRAWLRDTPGTGTGKNGRGTSAGEEYVFERDHPGHHDIVPEESWNWGSFYDEVKPMKREADGTYSYVWTFQTNSGDNYMLDALEINGVDLTLPFFPKSVADGYTAEIVGTESGVNVYVTETPLPDGIVAKVEYLYAWKAGGHAQRIYRLTVTGARTNVTVSGGNLMMYDFGAPEFVTYSLVGVHADTDTPAVQYYDKDSNLWKTAAMSNVVIEKIDYANGDASVNGANLRFKPADGYGNPYFLWESLHGGAIEGRDGKTQGSAQRLPDGSVANRNEVLPLPESGILDSRHIYESGDGWYYIRVNTQRAYQIALLTVAARPVRYMVHYETETPEVPAPENIPVYTPSPALTGISGAEQYDDNHGAYYDVLTNPLAAISPLKMTDPSGLYVFRYWLVVDETGDPVLDENGQELHFPIGNGMDIPLVNEYAVRNRVISSDEADIYVINLKPVWKLLTNPFQYNVVLNWIDANGVVQGEDFSDDWDAVLTEGPEIDGQSLVVYVNRQASPLQKWLEEHPKYRFWDELNTALDDDAVQAAVDNLFSYLGSSGLDISMFMTDRDVFSRFGKYGFGVKKDGGKIVIWMVERISGIRVSKSVIGDDDHDAFGFTVTLSDQTVNGTYGNMQFVNGVAEFSLCGGESKTAVGLPVGVTYRVTENEADSDSNGNRYVTTSTNTEGTIEDSVIAEILFVNRKQNAPQTGDNGAWGIWLGLLSCAWTGMIATIRFGRQRKLRRSCIG